MSNVKNVDFSTLNPEQKEAVEHFGGPLLLLAGAGSGKTRVITYRIAKLLDRGISPKHILAVSFTNKAATEMRERVGQLVGEKVSKKIYLSTFHSLGAEILRSHIDVLGYRRPFTILDYADQLGVVKSIMKEKNIDSSSVDAKAVLSMISKAKMEFKQPIAIPSMKFNTLMPFAQRVFSTYQANLKSLNATDFDDLICLPIRIFEKDEDVRRKYADSFQYVMVDEYQDTNATQLAFIRAIVAEHQNLVVVGDDDQSIYAFRGAVSGNILEFEYEFENTRTIKLEQNYRSTNMILNAANQLILNNDYRKEKNLWSDKGDGEKVRVISAHDEHEEAEFVIAECEKIHSNLEIPYQDMAILYRVNPQSRLFEDVCVRYNVPFTVVGSQEFYDRKEVKDAIAMLRVCMNPLDEVGLRRIVNVPPRGVGPTTLGKISAFAEENGVSFFHALRGFGSGKVGDLGHAAKTKISRFLQTMETYRLKFESPEIPLADLARSLFNELYFLEYLRSSELSDYMANRRIQNVEEFLKSLGEVHGTSAKSLEDFLVKVALDRSTEDDKLGGGLKMMTVHASKGLEFRVVFLVGWEEGYVPHQRSIAEGEAAIQEERRLGYVAITRAKEHLGITWCRHRQKFGQEMSREPSRFLDELPLDSCDFTNAEETASLVKKKAERNVRNLDALRAAIFD